MQLLSIGRYVQIPVEKGIQMRDKAREMVRKEREKAEVFNTAEEYFYTEVVVE